MRVHTCAQNTLRKLQLTATMGSLIKTVTRITQILPQSFHKLSPSLIQTHSLGEGYCPRAESSLKLASPSSCTATPSSQRAWSQEQATHQSVFMVQMKNWEPLVLGPAFAMDRTPANTSRMTRLPQEASHTGVTQMSRWGKPHQGCLSLKILGLRRGNQGPEDAAPQGLSASAATGEKGLVEALSGRAGVGPPALNSRLCHIAPWV